MCIFCNLSKTREVIPLGHILPAFCNDGVQNPAMSLVTPSITCKDYYCSVLRSGAIVPYFGNTDVCRNCGAQNCQLSACAARGRTCFAYGCRGHFQQYCRSSRRRRGRRPARVAEIVPEEDAQTVMNILTVHPDKSTGVYVDVGVQPVALASPPRIITFLVDTGSAVLVMGEQSFQNLFRDQVELKELQPCPHYA